MTIMFKATASGIRSVVKTDTLSFIGVVVLDSLATIKANIAETLSGDRTKKVRRLAIKSPDNRALLPPGWVVSGGLWLTLDEESLLLGQEDKYLWSGWIAAGPKGEDGFFDKKHHEAVGYKFTLSVPEGAPDAVLFSSNLNDLSLVITGPYSSADSTAVETA